MKRACFLFDCVLFTILYSHIFDFLLSYRRRVGALSYFSQLCLISRNLSFSSSSILCSNIVLATLRTEVATWIGRSAVTR